MRSNAFSLVVGNLASKFVGAFREVLFAFWFGTGEVAASFRISQTAYLLPTHAVIGDTLSAGLLPLYRKLKAEDVDQARLLVVIACIYGLLFSAIVTTLLFFLAHQASFALAPGAPTNVQSLSSQLLRILAFTTPFYVLSGLFGFIEAAYGRYGAVAWRPMLLNLGAIGGASLAVFTRSDQWLAIGLLLSHIALFAWTMIEFLRLDRLFPAVWQTRRQCAKVSHQFFLNILPLMGLPIISQLNILFERNISSWLGLNVIPSVDYARFIADTTIQLIAVPLGIVTLSRHGGSLMQDARHHIRGTMAIVMLMSFPISVFISQNAESLVKLLFARGAFDTESVQVTTSVLQWIGGSIGATATAYYLVKALNSQFRNSEALACTAIGCIAGITINLLFWRTLGPKTIGVASSASSFCLLVLSISRLGFWLESLPVMTWISIGCLLQFALSNFVCDQLKYPFDLLGGLVACAIVWFVFITATRPLRELTTPLLNHLLRKQLPAK